MDVDGRHTLFAFFETLKSSFGCVLFCMVERKERKERRERRDRRDRRERRERKQRDEGVGDGE